MKIRLAVIVLAVAALALAASGSATAFPHSVVPQTGHYRGEDERGDVVTFVLSDSKTMTHLKIGPVSLPNVPLLGPHWQGCDAFYCTGGYWRLPFAALGHWSVRGHRQIPFEANLVR